MRDDRHSREFVAGIQGMRFRNLFLYSWMPA